ncbi:MAG: NAD(P)/FAD-dependent oxidoreductase [Flammeovirgaceae bacterium]|nr:NAD(P)/FAD-dependent oxidoreductase [Flammeovirgaceae bacterium]MDW8286701.1 NAD(P)/FAD-dependent oxidoreductase [Flammeovirgaceae bacterium]
MDIGIIGGGAAGFMAAVTCASTYPYHRVFLFEKTNKLLSKVKISGGGRCNVTHACFDIGEFCKNYPRGATFLKKSFHQFFATHTVEWFERRGVRLKTEPDGRMFPITDNSQTIIDCFLREANQCDVKILTNVEIVSVEKQEDVFLLRDKQQRSYAVQRLMIATGGSPKSTGFEWIGKLGHTIEPPVPSLFTFNMPEDKVPSLMGISVEKTNVGILGTKLQTHGALLFTHWGMSGPAILKLSAWGARILAEKGYQFQVQVKWLPDREENAFRGELWKQRQTLIRQVENKNPFGFPQRLWSYFLEKAGIPEGKRWIDTSKKEINKLVEVLFKDTYRVSGKTTYKEEFVTCGGVSLHEVNPLTMESKVCNGLFFGGEVLDIDGITGGFNFQAAWTTGYIAGLHLGKS